ncbi:MAG: TetR/AcrR family transcriptional regulator [Ruminococcus sp.]|nr:TetR/AcrR family transcriptional regulator [Ruminococcus sp.]
MNIPNNQSAVRSRQEITTSLFRLMEQHPYSEITVKQIILEARLARKTFYRHYDSKDAVIKAFLLGIIKEYSDKLKAREADSLDLIFSLLKQHEHIVMLLDKNDMLHLLLIYLNEYLPEIHSDSDVTRDIPTRYFGGLDQEYLMAFNIGAVWNVVFRWVRKGMTDSPENIKAVLMEYVYKNIETRP